MLSCKDVSRLNSQAQERTLSHRERLGVRFHLLICKGCREFARQLQLMRRACQQWEQAALLTTQAMAQPVLPAGAKARIMQALATRSPEDQGGGKGNTVK